MRFHRLSRTLVRDPVMGRVAVVYAVLTLFYLVPLVAPQLLENLAWYLWDPVLLTLALVVVQTSLDRKEPRRVRRFWHLVSLALGFWLAASLLTSVLHLLYPNRWIDLLVDVLHLGYYLSLVLATDLKPDTPRHLERLTTDHRINLSAAVGLCFTLLVYFVLIPNHLDLGETTSLRSAVLLYLGLDLVLLTRFAILAVAARDTRWRITYRILAAGMLYSAVLVALEMVALFPKSPIPATTGTPWDLLWLLPFLPFIFAARLSRQMATTTRAAPEGPSGNTEEATTWGPALLYALLLPCAHLVLHHFGWLDAPSQRTREGLAILSFVIFGVLALVQYYRRERTRKQAQNSLRASEHRYRQLVESSPDAILVEREGRVAYANPTAQELFGRDHLEQDHGFTQMGLPTPPTPQTSEFLDLSSSSPLPIEYRLLDRHGQPLGVEVSYLWIRYQGSLACQATLRDVTALRALRAETEGMERLASLGEFAATIAHEIRNPLASLVFNTRYLSRRLPMAEADLQELLALERAIDMMHTTVTRVLELSRTEPPIGSVQTASMLRTSSAETILG